MMIFEKLAGISLIVFGIMWFVAWITGDLNTVNKHTSTSRAIFGVLFAILLGLFLLFGMINYDQ